MRIGHKPNLTNYKFKYFLEKKAKQLEFYNYLTSPVLNSYLLDIDQVKRGFDTFLSRFHPMIPALMELNWIYNISELLAEELNMIWAGILKILEDFSRF